MMDAQDGAALALLTGQTETFSCNKGFTIRDTVSAYPRNWTSEGRHLLEAEKAVKHLCVPRTDAEECGDQVRWTDTGERNKRGRPGALPLV